MLIFTAKLWSVLSRNFSGPNCDEISDPPNPESFDFGPRSSRLHFFTEQKSSEIQAEFALSGWSDNRNFFRFVSKLFPKPKYNKILH